MVFVTHDFLKVKFIYNPKELKVKKGKMRRRQREKGKREKKRKKGKKRKREKVLGIFTLRKKFMN